MQIDLLHSSRNLDVLVGRNMGVHEPNFFQLGHSFEGDLRQWILIQHDQLQIIHIRKSYL